MMSNPYANPFGSYGAGYQNGMGGSSGDGGNPYQSGGPGLYGQPPGGPPSGNPNSTSPGGFDNSFYYNQDPVAGYYAWLYGINPGLTGTGPEARFAQNSYGRYQGQYQAAAANDPMLQWYDWLKGRSVNPSQEFQAQSPEERGDYTSRSLTPRARWAGY